MESCPFPTWHLTNSTVLSDNGLKPSLFLMTYLKLLINNSVKLSLGKESLWSVQEKRQKETRLSCSINNKLGGVTAGHNFTNGHLIDRHLHSQCFHIDLNVWVSGIECLSVSLFLVLSPLSPLIFFYLFQSQN